MLRCVYTRDGQRYDVHIAVTPTPDRSCGGRFKPIAVTAADAQPLAGGLSIDTFAERHPERLQELRAVQNAVVPYRTSLELYRRLLIKSAAGLSKEQARKEARDEMMAAGFIAPTLQPRDFLPSLDGSMSSTTPPFRLKQDQENISFYFEEGGSLHTFNIKHLPSRRDTLVSHQCVVWLTCP